MAPDTLYAAIKAAPADCSTFTDATQKQVCQLTKAHLGIAQATGDEPRRRRAVVELLDAVDRRHAQRDLADRSTAADADRADGPRRRKQANAGLQGKANIYVGSTSCRTT